MSHKKFLKTSREKMKTREIITRKPEENKRKLFQENPMRTRENCFQKIRWEQERTRENYFKKSDENRKNYFKKSRWEQEKLFKENPMSNYMQI
jgi:hypothetical protein